MKSARIGVITFDRFPFEGRALRQARAATDAGFLIYVICIRAAHEAFHEIDGNTHIYRLPLKKEGNSSLASKLLYWSLFLLFAGVTATWLHLRHRFEIVHVHNMPDFLVFSALIPKLFGAKIILDIQDVTPELMQAKSKGRDPSRVVRFATWQEHISTGFADHVVTTGPLFEDLLLQRGVPAEKVTSILNSADPSIFPPERRCLSPFDACNSGEHPFVLMYHGTVEERNGLETAVRACALARATVPHLRLHIKGAGECLPAVKQLAQELGLSNDIVFSGLVGYGDRLVDFVVQGDVGIIPYRRNRFMDIVLPTKAYEFAWMGRAMIASDTRALRSMFRPEAIAFCEPDNPEAFAEAIIDLYQHPEKRASMIQCAAEDYEAYRWEMMAKKYQHLLETLVCQ